MRMSYCDTAYGLSDLRRTTGASILPSLYLCINCDSLGLLHGNFGSLVDTFIQDAYHMHCKNS